MALVARETQPRAKIRTHENQRLDILFSLTSFIRKPFGPEQYERGPQGRRLTLANRNTLGASQSSGGIGSATFGIEAEDEFVGLPVLDRPQRGQDGPAARGQEGGSHRPPHLASRPHARSAAREHDQARANPAGDDLGGPQPAVGQQEPGAASAQAGVGGQVEDASVSSRRELAGRGGTG